MPKSKEVIDLNKGSIEALLRCNFSGDDGIQHHIFECSYDANNNIRIYKSSGDLLTFTLEFGGTEVTTTYDISSWVAGTWYHCVFLWDKNTIDGTDYTWIYVDNSEVGNSTTELGYLENVESTFDFGADDGANQFGGSMHLRIWNIALPTTEANATTAGLPTWCSVAGLYNSGSGYDCPVTEHLLFKIVKD